MSGNLHQLLALRELRERNAARRLAACREALAAARQTLAGHRRALVEFRAGRPAREAALFTELQTHTVQLRELDEFKTELAALDRHDADLAGRIRDAELDQHKALEALQRARQVWLRALKAKQKLSEVVADENGDQARRREQQEDDELDEFSMLTAAGRGVA